MSVIQALRECRSNVRMFRQRFITHPLMLYIVNSNIFRPFIALLAPLKIDVKSGTVTDSEMVLLKELTEGANQFPGPIIDIGTLFGFTTTRMALWSQKKIITVDNYSWNPWCVTRDAHINLTSEVLLYLLKTDRVVQVNMNKNDFYNKYSGDVPAMAFIDASKDYEEVKRDIEWARRIGIKMICGHDYSYPGVRRAVDEAGGPKRLCGSLWSLC